MKAEDKDLLLRDLCARLPYGVKALFFDVEKDYISTIEGIDIYKFIKDDSGIESEISDVKPYLFPLSSMKGKHRAELFNLRINIDDPLQDSLCEIDFYHKKHFDYRGLIEKSLAIDATGLNIY